MIEADRLIQPTANNEDEVIDRAIRPKLLADYTGQDHVCAIPCPDPPHCRTPDVASKEQGEADSWKDLKCNPEDLVPGAAVTCPPHLEHEDGDGAENPDRIDTENDDNAARGLAVEAVLL